MTSSNPFKTSEAWEPSLGTYLRAGNYVVTIDSAEDGTKPGGHPQVELQLSNDQGSIRDWLVITPASAGKIVALAQSAGVDAPEDEDVADTDTWRLKPEWIFRLVGRKVGIVVRDEQRYGSTDPADTITRVQGYVPPAKIAGVASDATPKGAGNGFQAKPAKPAPDLPF